MIRRRDFVGVVAPKEWDAVRAARDLRVTWDLPEALPASPAALYDQMRSSKTIDKMSMDKGDVAAAFERAAHVVSHRFDSPYQAHAPFGPNCALADVKADSALNLDITLPAVTASGAPRSYQVVSLALPETLLRSPEVKIVVVPQGDFSILGPRARTVDAAKMTNKRVGVTIGIPANAVAGKLLAAAVYFLSPGSPKIVVPVEIDVGLVRKVLLRRLPGPLNAQAGSDVILPFDIANAGNAVERVSAELLLPSGWSTRGR